MRLGRIIGQWRRARKVGVRPVAKSIGVDHHVLWNFEQGHPVTSETLSKVLQWLLVEGPMDPMLANLVFDLDRQDEQDSSHGTGSPAEEPEVSRVVGSSPYP